MSNNKMFVSATLIIVSLMPLLSLGDNADSPPCPPGMDVIEYVFLSTEGGYLYLPNSGYGSFLFVNKQKRVPMDALRKIEPMIHEEHWVTLRFSEKQEKSEVAIEIIDDPSIPSLSVFPDDRRAVVNVSRLAIDNPTPELLASRTRKQMIRAFSFLGGITGGAGEGHIMDVMCDMKRLDAAKEEVPGELIVRNSVYLERSGVKPYVRETYKDACEQGHAPSPTNVWQRAIWRKVHERPTKPEKIKYDPSKAK